MFWPPRQHGPSGPPGEGLMPGVPPPEHGMASLWARLKDFPACRVRHRCQDPLPESSAGCADISTPWSPNVLAPRRRPTGPQTCRDPEDRQAGQRVTAGVEWADCKGSSGCVTVSERATPHRTYRERCGSDAAIPGVGRPRGQRHVASCG